MSTVVCPRCGETNPGDNLNCESCSAPLAEMGEMETLGGANVKASHAPSSMSAMAGGTPIPLMERGTLIAGGRYEILAILGQGAMGAVYKAKDLELDRWVAIKVIQPELSNSKAILKRFKQELILARQVTHRNVVRIFDIGETDGMKFITMEYVDGGDLKSVILERGKIPPEEAFAIVRQICHALVAAHAEGVVHRDLKPQNIMFDSTGRVVVMDFGIAHSKDAPSMTMTGALMGTPEYMSPEQAKGDKTDHRADIFAVGIIFYELLIGRVPFQARTVVETMYKRTMERAVPPVDVDRSVPIHANRIVMKCLETDPANRYQDVKELIKDLDEIDPNKKISVMDRVKRTIKRRSRLVASLAAVAAIVLIAVIAGFFIRGRIRPGTETAHAPLTVLVADFNNHTGDTVFDGALERVVKLALESAGFITAYERTQMPALGLPAVAAGKLDEPAARQIAVSQGLGVVISGSLDRKGDGYSLSLKAAHAVTGDTIGIAEEIASQKAQVVFATTKVASAIRKALGDDTSESASRFAMETLSATSLEAVHEYATAMDFLSNGKYGEALKGFEKAVEFDEQFGLAYAGMAIASRNQGQQAESEKHIKVALNHITRMTDRERLRTRGVYYSILGNPQKCVEEYGALITSFPSDVAAHNNLAFCYTQLRDMPKALEQVRHAATILPKRLIYRWNVSLYASYGNDFTTGEKEARSLQETAPDSPLGLSALAFAQMGQGQVAQATGTYQKLETMGGQNASDARAGLADLAMYEGRYSDAVRILEQGATVDLANKEMDRAARKFASLAYTNLLRGQKAPAIAAAEKAIQSRASYKTRFLAGMVFAANGETARARKLAGELSSELLSERQAYGRMIEGEIALASGDYRAAIKSFTDANNLVNTWIGHFGLGRAYLAEKLFTEADSEFDLCIKRRGEALALFLDESPTSGYFPQVYYFQGRGREGLGAGFAESYRTYVSIRGKSSDDPLLADARKRAGQ